MASAPFYQVDAFTLEPFKGNPAAVCLVQEDLCDARYLAVSQEMNLSETAFLDDRDGAYHLKWYTPVREVPLCGHATLATAHVLFNHRGYKGNRIEFSTVSGPLFAEKVRSGIRMDFPANRPFPVEPPAQALEALGVKRWRAVLYSDSNQKLLVHIDDPKVVRDLKPDFQAFLASPNPLGWRGAIVTSEEPGGYDFISRYFAPYMGVDEDPVTGSAHTVLAPYWGEVLGKQRMRAFQASRRGGELTVELAGDRVLISGSCVTVAEGEIRY